MELLHHSDLILAFPWASINLIMQCNAVMKVVQDSYPQRDCQSQNQTLHLKLHRAYDGDELLGLIYPWLIF